MVMGSFVKVMERIETKEVGRIAEGPVPPKWEMDRI
jgi:hypothetical protein